MPDMPTFRPGERPSARKLNRQSEALEGIRAMKGDGIIKVDLIGDTLCARLDLNMLLPRIPHPQQLLAFATACMIDAAIPAANNNGTTAFTCLDNGVSGPPEAATEQRLLLRLAAQDGVVIGAVNHVVIPMKQLLASIQFKDATGTTLRVQVEFAAQYILTNFDTATATWANANGFFGVGKQGGVRLICSAVLTQAGTFALAGQHYSSYPAICMGPAAGAAQVYGVGLTVVSIKADDVLLREFLVDATAVGEPNLADCYLVLS